MLGFPPPGGTGVASGVVELAVPEGGCAMEGMGGDGSSGWTVLPGSGTASAGRRVLGASRRCATRRADRPRIAQNRLLGLDPGEPEPGLAEEVPVSRNFSMSRCVSGGRPRPGTCGGPAVRSAVRLQPPDLPLPNKQKGAVRSAKKGQSAIGVKGGEQIKGLRPRR